MKPKRPRQRWRRGLWTLFVLVLIMIVAHRPLLQVGVGWWGRHYAAKKGYTLEWQISGSVISDLTVNNLRLEGPEDAVVKQIHWGRASVDIGLWNVLRGGFVESLRRFTLKDASIVVDARPPSAPQAPRAPSALPDVWLQRLDLTNLNARILTQKGDVVLRGFTLVLDDTKPGELKIDELTQTAAGRHVASVHGITEVKGSRVIITNLVIAPDFDVPLLSVDLQYLRDGSVPFEIAARSGQAAVESSGRVDDIAGRASLDLTLALTEIAHSDVARWMSLPMDTSWLVESAKVRVKGPLDEPQKLDATLSLSASNIHSSDVHIESLRASASVADGKVIIESLTANDGPNRIEVTATARLPPTWNEMEKLTADFQWRLRAPQIERVAALGQDFTGKLRGEGSVSFVHGDLDRAQASLHGEEVAWRRQRIKEASLEVQIHAGRADISMLKVQLDDDNGINVTGDVELAHPQTVKLHWQTDIKNIATVADWLDVKDWPLPSAGGFASQGTASFSLADVRTRNHQNLRADATASVKDVVWANGLLDQASLAMSIVDARLEVRKLEVCLNDRNTLKATGHVMLDETGEFDAEISGGLEELADFSGWMELAKQPRITSGRAAISWKGGGEIAQGEITGSGSLNVSDLKIEGRPDVFAIALETSHAGRTAAITKLVMSAGELRAEAEMTITEIDLVIPKLVLYSGETQLINGSAEVPLALAQTPRPALPLDSTRPIKVHLHVAKLEMQSLYSAFAKQAPVSGFAGVDLNLNGTLAELTGTLSATLTEVRSEAMKGKLEPAKLQVNASLNQRVLSVQASALMRPLQTITATAELPFDAARIIAEPTSLMDTPLTAHITLPNSNLAVLKHFAPQITAIQGSASADVELSGSMRKPEWLGTLTADASQVVLRTSDMDIRDVKVRATFNGQRVTLDDVSASLSGGTAHIGGSIDLASLTDPGLELQLEAKQALIVRNDTMSLRADGSLTITGTLTKADVTGRVELVRGRVFKEIEYLPLSLPNQLPPPPPQVKRRAAPSAPPFFALWNLNVDIVTGEPIRLLGNVLNGSATADMHVSGTGALPVLEGKISQQGARLRLPFSSLSLSRGDIIYTKEKPFDPQIDLQGEALVDKTNVTVFATGPATKPTIRFISSPPLTEPEIAMLLAMGTTVGDAQSTSGVAANRAAFLVLSKAYRKAFNKTPSNQQAEDPGRFSLNLNPLNTNSEPGNFSATYKITPQMRAEVGLGEHGVRSQVSYLVRFR